MASMCTFSCSILLCNTSLSGRGNIFASNKRLYSPRTPTMASTTRRLANYQPSLWSYDYLQSLTSKYTGEKYTARLQTLKEVVRTLIWKESGKVANPSGILNLVDDLQRLGISYHFMDEISNGLEIIYSNHYKSHEKWNEMDLTLKSQGFRLLRKHGYHIPQEIFQDTKDVTGKFKVHLFEDMVGMLNLYEASYLSVEDESILDEARDFTRRYLKESLENIVDQNMSMSIRHALVLPLHWRIPRAEAKWFLEFYKKRSDMNPTLIELAKLDFNMVQSIHQEDLKCASGWWRGTCWEKFNFARDRLVENFIWTMGQNYLPHFGGRITLTKVCAMLTTIDDVYDVYGTLHELEQFTDIVSSWDINAVEGLPDYMKICFFGFYNSINEIAYNTLTDKGLFILPYVKKAWQDICKSHLVEAKWYHSGYTPTFDEYINNACISIGCPVILVHAYLLTLNSITEEALQCIGRAENMIRYVSLIVRLINDMVTSSDELERGDVPKSVQCYMQDSGATEVEARAYIKLLIMETWKKLNKECQVIDSSFPQEFIEMATNLARMGHFMYSAGDGHGKPDITKPHVLSLFVNPIQGVP